jgi:hypothetical protein
MKAPAEPCTANSEQGASMSEHADWPELCYEEWAPTKKTLHMVSQMIGKAKLALVPPQPEWLHARLGLDGHGFTTGPLPYGSRVATIGIDVFTSTLWIRVSDGRGADVPLGHLGRLSGGAGRARPRARHLGEAAGGRRRHALLAGHP